ncbi:MAG: NAD(P)H-dependent oxidoreductase [Polyangiaceae bacterium]
MTRKAILIAGSPTANSRSTWLLDSFGQELAGRGFQLESFNVESFPPEALLRGQFDGVAVKRFSESLKGAHAVVFSTPVYKATYAGSLKVIVDLIDPGALEGKALLGIASAKLAAHLTEVDQNFQRLYAFFRGSRGLPSLGLLDAQLGAPGAHVLDTTAKQQFEAALQSVERATS